MGFNAQPSGERAGHGGYSTSKSCSTFWTCDSYKGFQLTYVFPCWSNFVTEGDTKDLIFAALATKFGAAIRCIKI